jgi:hypothetical protein
MRAVSTALALFLVLALSATAVAAPEDIYGVNKRVGFQALSSEQLVGAWMSLLSGK